jgi:hypothetical protein
MIYTSANLADKNLLELTEIYHKLMKERLQVAHDSSKIKVAILNLQAAK